MPTRHVLAIPLTNGDASLSANISNGGTDSYKVAAFISLLLENVYIRGLSMPAIMTCFVFIQEIGQLWGKGSLAKQKIS